MTIEHIIATRLREMKSDFERGKKFGVELENQLASLREQMLRLNGAIQILTEISEGEAASSEQKIASLG